MRARALPYPTQVTLAGRALAAGKRLIWCARGWKIEGESAARFSAGVALSLVYRGAAEIVAAPGADGAKRVVARAPGPAPPAREKERRAPANAWWME